MADGAHVNTEPKRKAQGIKELLEGCGDTTPAQRDRWKGTSPVASTALYTLKSINTSSHRMARRAERGAWDGSGVQFQQRSPRQGKVSNERWLPLEVAGEAERPCRAAEGGGCLLQPPPRAARRPRPCGQQGWSSPFLS